MSTNHIRSKWAAVGAAIAVSLGAGGIGITQATTSSGEKPIYLPIEPCRLTDTRAEFQVGPRSAPLGPNETYTLSGHGTVGNCNLPTESTALSLNVTAINATQPTFISLFPAGADLPVASHLNPLPGQGPVPNAVNVDLDNDGEFSIYNLQGNVDIFIDVVGIYDDHNHDDRYYTEAESDAKYLPTDQRATSAFDGGNSSEFVGVDPEVLASVTVQQPSRGRVIVNSSVFATGGPLTAHCSITTGTGLDTAYEQRAAVPGGDGGANLAGTRGYNVFKGVVLPSPDTQTYNLVCTGSDFGPTYQDANITAIFVPDPSVVPLFVEL